MTSHKKDVLLALSPQTLHWILLIFLLSFWALVGYGIAALLHWFGLI
jgi:hypothetical protein